MSGPEYLAVVGTMGVGKTTVAEMISQDWGHTVYKERPEKNPFLQGQYEDRIRNAFQTQVWFIEDIYRQITRAQNTQKDAVFDAWITQYGMSYAPTLLKNDELETYNKLYTAFNERIQQPSLLICLQAEIPEIVRRCMMRDRDFERKISVEYLTALDTSNRKWIKESTLPKVIIETDGLDIVNSAAARKHMLDRIDHARNTT